MEKEEWFERSTTRGVIEARREMNWESFDMVERRAVRLLMFGEEGLEKEVHMEKEKKCEIIKSQKIELILYFYFC